MNQFKMAQASKRKENLKRFSCSICGKAYRYLPYYQRHMAVHALESSKPSVEELSDLSSRLVSCEKEVKTGLSKVFAALAEMQVALSRETAERERLEFLIKSRGLRSDGLHWSTMYTLSSLKIGMAEYSSIQPQYKYSSYKGHFSHTDIMTEMCQLLAIAWGLSHPENDQPGPRYLWIHGALVQFEPWEFTDMLVPHLLETVPQDPSFYKGCCPHPSHIDQFLTDLQGYVNGKKRFSCSLEFRKQDRMKRMQEAVCMVFGVRSWECVGTDGSPNSLSD